MIDPCFLGIAEIEAGQSAQTVVTFTADLLEDFGSLSADRAPVHADDGHGRAMGFQGRIAHGFLVAMPYSRMLGMILPGANTVIHSVDLQMAAPVHVGDTVTYRVTVQKLIPSVRSVKLSLQAENQRGETVSRGSATCVFRP